MDLASSSLATSVYTGKNYRCVPVDYHFRLEYEYLSAEKSVLTAPPQRAQRGRPLHRKGLPHRQKRVTAVKTWIICRIPP